MVYQGGENIWVQQSKTPAQITVVTSNISFGHDNNNHSSEEGEKKAHDAQECMETEGHRALKLQKKTS